jgi:hypothetical protein
MRGLDFLPAWISTALAGSCLMLSLAPGIALGDEWLVKPSLQFRTQHDDNIGLRTDSPLSSWWVNVSPLLDLRKQTPTGTFAMGGRLIFNRYSNDSLRDTDIQLLTLTASTATRRSRFGVGGAYRRDTTLTTAATPVDDSGNPDAGTAVNSNDDVDVNIVTTQARRGRLTLRPYWSYILSELTTLRLGYTLNNTTYADDAGTSLSDYRRHQIQATLARRLGRNDSVSAGIGSGRFDAADRGTESDDYSANAGWAHDFTPLTRGTLALGLRSVTSTDDGVEIKSSGALFDMGLVSKYSEVERYEFSLSRDLYPSGVGTLVLSDFLRVDYSRGLSSRLTFSLEGSAFKNQSAGFFSSSIDRVHYEIEPSLRWMVGRLWSVDMAYRYRWQKYADEADHADSNAIFVAMDYAWPRMAVSQ